MLSDLQVSHFVTGIRALGIIDKIVTGPFWRHLDSSSVSILEMSDTYSKMKNKFEEWSKDAHPQVIHDTKSVPKTNVTPERDFAVLDRLMTQKPNATYIVLESLLLYSQ